MFLSSAFRSIPFTALTVSISEIYSLSTSPLFPETPECASGGVICAQEHVDADPDGETGRATYQPPGPHILADSLTGLRCLPALSSGGADPSFALSNSRIGSVGESDSGFAVLTVQGSTRRLRRLSSSGSSTRGFGFGFAPCAFGFTLGIRYRDVEAGSPRAFHTRWFALGS